ncbi:MAG: hypothetical protein HY808_01245 [Nitrospirae bacterium]|nr:hypothetical protein [Nitrospirota bacterium]
MLLEEIKNIKAEKSDLRKFGLTVGGAFLILGGVLFWYNKGAAPYILIVSAVLIFSGLLFPQILKPLYRIWMTLAVILGWFMTRVILGILFYLVFTAIGLVPRLLGKQFLDLKMDNTKESYWILREPKQFKQSDYERQF